MANPVYFTVVADFKAFIEDASTDSDYDPQQVPLGGTVVFTPLVNTGDVLLATDASPRPVGYIPAPITAIIDPADGRLKLRKTADSGGTGTFAPVRLLGNSPLLNLTGPLFYRVQFNDIVYSGNRAGSIAGFNFEAPSTDIELNLITVFRSPGQTASGLTKIAPGGVRLDGNNIIFTFGGADIPDPIPTSAFAGPKGDTGSAGTVTIGTVSTGSPGSSATITNTGTPTAAVLDFSLPRGDTGNTGAKGDAATIQVGTVTTGNPGSSATVTNSGTSSAAVLDFSLPRGDTGAAGATGATGSKGDKGDAATITVGTVTTASAGGSATVTNVGNSSAAVFDITIPRGDKGETGDTGPKGDAATIQVGTVSTGAPGSSVTFTNVGTSSAAVIDVSIPKGDTGATGATGSVGPQGPPGIPGVNIKGNVTTYANLPSTGNADRDAYVVTSDGLLYIWSGSAWPNNGDGVRWVGPPGSSVSQLVGDGSATSITVTHGLGTRAVSVAVYDATTWAEVECDVTATSNNAVTLGFASAPPLNGYLCAVVSGGSSGTTSWSGITDKPTTDGITEGTANLYFTALRAQNALTSQLAAKADVAHTHSQSDVTGLTTELAAKEPSITPGTTAQWWRGDKSWQSIDKTAVGLSNVDNTADIDKSVRSASKLTTATTIDGQSFDGSSAITVIAPGTNAAASKSTPVDADVVPLVDSEAALVLKKLSWSSIKAALKTYFDSLATTLSNKTLASPALTGTTKAASGSVVELYGTADQTTNFEKLALSYSGGFAIVSSDNGGTGTARTLRLRGGNGRRIDIGGASVTNAFIECPDGTSAAGITGFRLNNGTWNATSGVNPIVAITPTINQSSSAGYTALQVAVTETATGSGTKRLIDAQVGGSSRFSVDNGGNVSATGRVGIATGNAPASATAAGVQGQIAWDADYFYVCTATNTWKRAAITTW